jgi:hypothetical protein
LYRKWELNRVQDPSIALFEEWVRGDATHNDFDSSNPKDIDRLMMSTKPSQRVVCYTRMKAFENHFRVEDVASTWLQTYDSGVASIFQVPMPDARDVSMNYVGVLKDILKLDYKLVRTLIILFRCEWMKRQHLEFQGPWKTVVFHMFYIG